MKIYVENCYSVITEATEEQTQVIKKLCTITHIYKTKKKGQRYAETKKRSICYYNEQTGRIPTGLLSRLKDKVEARYFDRRKKPEKNINVELSLPKFPVSEADYSFQEEAVQSAIKHGRGILHYPTGSGKTIIMAKIINSLQIKTLVMVPDLVLLSQIYENFCDYFGKEKVNYFGDNNNGLGSDICIATQQSLSSLLERDKSSFMSLTKEYGILFTDECHHIAEGSPWTKKNNRWERKENTANSWYKVAMNLDIYHRYGMTATLDTEDNPNNQFILESAINRVIGFLTESDAISRNVLCEVEVIMINNPCKRYSVWKTEYKKDGSVKYEGAYDNNIIKNEKRNLAIVKLTQHLYKQNNNILIHVDSVKDHGKPLHNMIPESKFLWGKSNKKERALGIKQAKESKNGSILIGTIFKEGFDFPGLNIIIMGGGGKSTKKVKQQKGRASRMAEGKLKAYLFDFYDEDGSMCERHSKVREKVYKSQNCNITYISIEEVLHGKKN
jgi:superfamily II DNA or RNA helicase